MKVKISAAWGKKQLACVADRVSGPDGCGGACCRSVSYWPPSAGSVDGACDLLGATGCTLALQDRPVTCLLYPMKLNKSHTLILHYRAGTGVCKANFGHGPMVIEAIKPQLAVLFGQAEADRLVAEVKQGRSPTVEFSIDLVNALHQEEAWERDGVVPQPRSQAHSPVQMVKKPAKKSEAPTVAIHCAFDKLVPIDELQPRPDNPNKHPDSQIQLYAKAIEGNGWRRAITVSTLSGMITRGHGALLAARRLGLQVVPVDFQEYENEQMEMADVVADNRLAELADTDDALLRNILGDLASDNFDMEIAGFDDYAFKELFAFEPPDTGIQGSLAERFLVPPFSVLNARDGIWQNRKRAWIERGVNSELGRDSGLVIQGNKHLFSLLQAKSENTGPASMGTSVFDPVLCELLLRWYSGIGHQVVDPFAGGSVRGLVASALGRRYWGCDIRKEQIDANLTQAAAFLPTDDDVQPTRKFYGPDETTPIEKRGQIWVKRDDLCVIHDARGGKARTCFALCQHAATGLTTAGSLHSPQVLLVATMARALGLPCVAHVPSGELDPDSPVAMAEQLGAEIVQHTPGYNSVIIARSRKYAADNGFTEIPFGMECDEAVQQTRRQVKAIPKGVKRIVVPVGSGMSLAGVLHGLQDAKLNIPVLGVITGADPLKRLDKYAPSGWRDTVQLVNASKGYGDPVTAAIESENDDPLPLDPIYEAKCAEHLQKGDLLWIVGHRDPVTSRVERFPPVWVLGDSQRQLEEAPDADMLFTCPPYGDLEQYGDNPEDLSNMPWPAFLEAYRQIVSMGCAKLKQDRFACIVVGDFRDPDGNYRNFVGETIRAFLDAGLQLYNEAILVTEVGTAPVRAPKIFISGRKLVKTHQNVLVFVKGDSRAAAKAVSDGITVDVEQYLRRGGAALDGAQVPDVEFN